MTLRANNLAIEEATAQAPEQWMRDQSDVAAEESNARPREAIKKARGYIKGTGL